MISLMAMPTLPETGKKNMSANAIRVARYGEKMRAKGLKKLSFWVTPEEEQFIRAFILKHRKQREDLVPTDRTVSTGKPSPSSDGTLRGDPSVF